MGQALFDKFHTSADKLMELESIQKLFKSNRQFDVILADLFLNEAIVAGFVKRFDAPLIVMSTAVLNNFISAYVGDVAPSSYVPVSFFKVKLPMDFKERMKNFLFNSFFEYMRYSKYNQLQQEIFDKHFGSLEKPTLNDILYNISLVLINHHFSLGYPRPLLPNLIEIGGIHVKPPKKLEPDLQNILDQATDGAIFFSLGSNLKPSEIEPQTLTSILEVFKKFNKTVLWKWDGEEFKIKPERLYTSKWYPQSDILAHPNVRVFITHGGLLSTIEAFVRKVPVVGIPIVGDQGLNIAQVESIGCGRSLEYRKITEENFFEVLSDVWNNAEYREKISYRSQLLKDLPRTPLETAIFWIEYVIRHKGAPHFRSPALDLSWYQINSLDVIMTISFFLILAIFVLSKLTQYLWRFCICKIKYKQS